MWEKPPSSSLRAAVHMWIRHWHRWHVGRPAAACCPAGKCSLLPARVSPDALQKLGCELPHRNTQRAQPVGCLLQPRQRGGGPQARGDGRGAGGGEGPCPCAARTAPITTTPLGHPSSVPCCCGCEPQHPRCSTLGPAEPACPVGCLSQLRVSPATHKTPQRRAGLLPLATPAMPTSPPERQHQVPLLPAATSNTTACGGPEAKAMPPLPELISQLADKYPPKEHHPPPCRCCTRQVAEHHETDGFPQENTTEPEKMYHQYTWTPRG